MKADTRGWNSLVEARVAADIAEVLLKGVISWLLSKTFSPECGDGFVIAGHPRPRMVTHTGELAPASQLAPFNGTRAARML
jgi:hypothetical protein